jgi:hypothetical protein
MEELRVFSGGVETADRFSATEPVYEEASLPFVGRWNRLISTTNWEKGRIIAEWRQALIDASAAAREYADEAWARRVGAVTGQHAGRLRRVYERFGTAYQDYAGLYWSHFHAALDWHDAEMWLEGAVQSDWSVSQMRRQRWEATGAAPADRPRDEDIVVASPDEDVVPQDQEPLARRLSDDLVEIHGPAPEGPDFGDAHGTGGSGLGDGSAVAYTDVSPEESVPLVRPFENLAELPEDLAEAFEAFKLAILRHKAERWAQISLADVLAALDSLKQLALAPSPE